MLFFFCFEFELLKALFKIFSVPFEVLKRCFTSTETVGLLGTGAQDVHLDFHTVPELCVQLLMLKCCCTFTETVCLLRMGAQDVHFDFHTAPELCSTIMSIDHLIIVVFEWTSGDRCAHVSVCV